jgi:hypothetical protein
MTSDYGMQILIVKIPAVALIVRGIRKVGRAARDWYDSKPKGQLQSILGLIREEWSPE